MIPYKLEGLPDADADCLRCGTRLKSADRLSLLKSSELSPLVQAAVQGAGMVNADVLDVDVEVCPKCGKLEFFL